MNKVPLILLPGLLCDAEVWRHQCDALTSIADIYIPNLNQAASKEAMVASVLEESPANFALAGHSMGGWVALEIMKYCPERVLGLALLNTTAFPDSKEKQDARKTMIATAEKGNYLAIIDKLIKLFVYNPRVATKVRMMLERNQLAFINQEKAMLEREECVAVLERIACHTLIIHSENDAVFHFEDADQLIKKIKHANFHVIKNCGHMSPMESPDEVTQWMKLWLESL